MWYEFQLGPIFLLLKGKTKGKLNQALNWTTAYTLNDGGEVISKDINLRKEYRYTSINKGLKKGFKSYSFKRVFDRNLLIEGNHKI